MGKLATEILKKAVYDITSDVDQKAYLHPVRMKILGYLVAKPMTISQVAEELKVHPANITHHFRTLESSRLIRLVEERDTGRVVERYFGAIAQTFNITPPEGAVQNVNFKTLSFLRNDLSSAISVLNPDDSEDVTGLIQKARINKDQYAEFAIRLEKLIKEFGNSDRDDGESYALNVSLYPHKKDYGPIGKIEIKKKTKKATKLRRV